MNENVIKNMASEVTRNCQVQNINVEVEFVVYIIELLLLNPKYGKYFTTTLNRNNLEYFVNEVVGMLTRGGVAVNTLKMQFIIEVNYDKPEVMIDKHMDSIDSCLRPLVNEILDSYPDPEDEAAVKKLFRKISIYIVLCSGLGNPALMLNLKEGMAALESVFSLDDLKVFASQPRKDKMDQLEELLEIASGVRLFNRDCKKGGEMIPDLPFDLVDAGKACLASLSNSLITVMQRVNTLTTAVEDSITIHEETGNVIIDIPEQFELTEENYKLIFELLTFNRQYELIIRRLLADAEWMVYKATSHVEKVRAVLEELHAAVKYKAAVPVDTVFPLFAKLWRVWRAMQNTMYLVSTVNRLMSVLAGIQDHMKIPQPIIEKMLRGKQIMTDQERISVHVTLEDRLSLGSLKNYISIHHKDDFSTVDMKERHIMYLGFCALCLNVGALIPSNLNIGLIRWNGKRFGFCSVKMATRFSKDPDRYVNEVLEYARNNPHVINLLTIMGDVQSVRNIENIVTRYLPKKLVFEKDIQTETHPIETYKEKNYSWDLWEWKRRACQWATIVNCRTHSTQTNYSHLRSEIHCQTVEPRDKCLQTKKDAGMNTNTCNFFMFGLRGKIGDEQHVIDMVPKHAPEKPTLKPVMECTWPCVGSPPSTHASSAFESTEDLPDFYNAENEHR